MRGGFISTLTASSFKALVDIVLQPAVCYRRALRRGLMQLSEVSGKWVKRPRNKSENTKQECASRAAVHIFGENSGFVVEFESVRERRVELEK